MKNFGLFLRRTWTPFKLGLLAMFLSLICFQLHAKDNVRKECFYLQSFLSSPNFQIDCHTHYHHYNSSASKKFYNKSKALKNDIKLATFNLLYPGNSANRYKDYGIVAKIINKWDLVGAQELVPSVGKAQHHNKVLMTSKASSPKLIKNHYKLPGFLKVLNELRKLDPSWSLLLSSKGEAAKEEYVKELGGFFYRSSVVHPVINDFCEDNYDHGKQPAYGCLSDFTKETVGKNLNSIFSRKPFIGSFKSGNFDFTLLNTHVIYTSPTNPDVRAEIVRKAFDVDSHKDLGKGANGETYARFAEIKSTLKFMTYLLDYYEEEDVILLGDFNVEKKNAFWSKIIDYFEGAKILNDDPTSLTDQLYKFKRGEKYLTNGLSRNYDNFIINPDNSSECSNKASAFNFMGDNSIGKEIRKNYLVRSNKKRGSTYPINTKNQKKIKKLVSEYKKNLETKLTIKRNKVVKDSRNIERYVKGFERRVFQSQKKDNSFYHFYKEVISDHLPVSISCDTSRADDD
ncbi:MAG: hypothetical protein CME68_03825 [Halobacteriovoraceae bacterium]|nr:hypothetical protein [Halobacteriovoraceae bacterium]